MRLLFWLVLAILVIFALRKRSQAPSSPAHSSNTKHPENNDNGEAMVCCERCHVYIPSSEAVFRGEKVYCCSDHADQA